MDLKDLITINGNNEGKLRIIQELVPGKQITLAHIIANPDEILYQKLELDYSQGGAIGVTTVSPAETAIIIGDIAIKTANVDLGFLDRFSGTLILTGKLSEVEASMRELLRYCRDVLGFTVCNLTKT